MAKRTKSMIENNITDEIRLNKYLSDSGVCSRREADRFIEEGKVKVDGQVAIMGTRIKKGQVVTLNGKTIEKDEKLVLIAYNKPCGIVCTTDRREPDNIVDYINYGKRIYPIGRLDKDSEGLILLTNTGEIVNKILRAGNNHEKEYIVTVNKPITTEFLKGMASGVPILDTITKPCQIKALDKFVFQIILTQGLNRQIRRMCEYFGYKVLELKRVRIMNINLGRLKVGDYRNVTESEIKELNRLIKESSNDAQIEYEDECYDVENYTQNKSHFTDFSNKYGKSGVHKRQNKEGYHKKQEDVNKKDKNFKDKDFKDKNFKDKNFKDKNFKDKNIKDKNFKDNDYKITNKQGKAGQGKTSEEKLWRSKTNQGKTGQDTLGKGKTGHDNIGKVKTGQFKTEQGKNHKNIENWSKQNDENSTDFKYTRRSQKLMSKQNSSKKDAYKAIVKGNKSNKFSSRRGK